MKLVSFILKIAGAGLGALGGLIALFIGFSDKALPGTSMFGLAFFGIGAFLVGYVLETADFKTLFPPKAPRATYAPQVNQSFANTQSYTPPQGFANTQSYEAPQAFTNTQSYDAPKPQAAPAQPAPAQPTYTAPQQPMSAGQQSFNESLNSANQIYNSSYSFSTPEDPQ